MKKSIFHLILMVLIQGSLIALDQNEIKIQREDLTHYLSALVKMPTLTAHQAENSQALQWIKQELKDLPVHIQDYTFNGYPSCVITTQKTLKPTVWLVAHVDVVPGEPFLFEPKVEQSIMKGRGTYDMKMAIACYLLLMHELKNDLAHYNIGIMLTSDEEIGGMNGVRCLLNKGYTSEVAFLPDGGFNWNFEQEAKGVLQVKLAAKGKSAHSSRPWEGINAIQHLIKGLEKIDFYFEKEKKPNQTYYATANTGLIIGGESLNQVAAFAEAKVDIRFPFPKKADQIYHDLQEVIKTDPHLHLEKLIEASPHHVSLDQPFFEKFSYFAKELYDIKIGSVQSHGASDARYFGEKNIPVLVISCRGGDIHSDQEWIDLDDLARFYQVMKKWVMAIAYQA